ncbi:MAG: hypothetical protein P1T08_04755 [Acidimicrobiia bacterium]|nr:hypothetical protein [Acidimicrobiia bacterium]
MGLTRSVIEHPVPGCPDDRLRSVADAYTHIQNTTKGLVQGAGEAGADIADVTAGAISGAISGAKDVGLSLEDVASAAAAGALEAAEEIGEAAVHTVRDVAATGVGGVKAVLKGQTDTPQE